MYMIPVDVCFFWGGEGGMHPGGMKKRDPMKKNECLVLYKNNL